MFYFVVFFLLIPVKRGDDDPRRSADIYPTFCFFSFAFARTLLEGAFFRAYSTDSCLRTGYGQTGSRETRACNGLDVLATISSHLSLALRWKGLAVMIDLARFLSSS